ncbi:hypothetical protein BK659_08405 [Pseudomonas brassicacearum]|uniref:Uncharacterized protein n=1 Tax=Pseudomonas brassicacearum TaxID=930166 RepID=A0A423H9M2_9PSED|nr:hypothetical protein BK659_08405 [Pseudomonas brassicacearum]
MPPNAVDLHQIRAIDGTRTKYLIQIRFDCRQWRKNGFHQMYSIDASSNAPMRDLAKFLGFETHSDPDDARQVIYRLML